jgi:hypothetical protein
MAVRAGVTPRQVDVRQVQAALRATGVAIPDKPAAEAAGGPANAP